MRKLAMAGLSTLAVFAFSCGGGGGGDLELPGGGGAGGGSISITSLSIQPSNNLQVGNTYSISWSVALGGSVTGNYHIEFFEYSQPTTPPSGITGLYRIAQSNCGPGFQNITGCGSSGVLDCEVRNLMGTPTTLCKVRGSSASPTSKGLVTSGNGYMVVRACNDLFTVCTVRTIQVTFP